MRDSQLAMGHSGARRQRDSEIESLSPDTWPDELQDGDSQELVTL